jgi:hypothetical protein
MRRVAFLDSRPLGEVVKPKRSPDIDQWLEFTKEKKIALRVAEIVDYELRRELTLQNLHGNKISYKSIHNLNKFRQRKQFISLTSEAILDDACEIWASLRFNNQGTANIKNIDVDVILAAQALSQKNRFDEVIIVTGNPSDICRFSYLDIQTWHWKQALQDCKYDCINFYQ